MQWNNLLNSLDTNTVPAWAKAENLEQCVGLIELWGLSSQVQREKKHPLRKKIAHELHKIASKIDFADEVSNPSLGYAKA